MLPVTTRTRITRTRIGHLGLFFALLLLSGIFAAPSFAQQGSIEGEVVNEKNGKPIPGVNVEVEGTGLGSATTSDGTYDIQNVPEGSYQLVASFVGFQTSRKSVSVEAGETVEVNFSLVPAEVKMQEVEIVGRSATDYESEYSFGATKTATLIENTPVSLSVVTKEVLEDQQAYRLDEVLKNVSGANTFSTYNDYTLRGFRYFEARLINGLKAGASYWTNPILPHIERVEVIKGPASALYANTNPGGTINMVTKKPLRSTRRSLDVTLGSYDTYRATADFTGPLTDDNSVLYRLNVGYENKDSFRRLQGSESLLVAPSVSFIPSDQTRVNLDVVFSTVDTKLDRGQPVFNETDDLTSTPIEFSLSQPGDFMRNTNFQVTASLSHEFTDWLSFNSSYMKYRLDHNLEEHRTSNVFLPNDPTVLQMAFVKRKERRIVDNATNYFTMEQSTGPIDHEVVLGFDVFRQQENVTSWAAVGDEDLIDPRSGKLIPGAGGGVPNFDLDNPTYTIQGRDPSNYTPNLPSFSQEWKTDPVESRTYGVYLQDQLQWNDLRLLLSMRREWYRDILPREDGNETVKQSAWTPRVGAVYSLPGGVNVYGTYAEGFQPQSTDAFLNPSAGGPFDPEKSRLYEVGAKAKFFDGQLLATTALYQIKKENVLISANEPGKPELLVQRGGERSRGIEFEVSGQLSPGLLLTANYAYNNAIVTEAADEKNEGKVKENAPHHMAGSWMKYTVGSGPLQGLGIGVGTDYVSERETFDESLQLPSYFLVNASAFYTVNNFEITLSVDNVFDETHWTGGYTYSRLFPGTPRSYSLKLGYKF